MEPDAAARCTRAVKLRILVPLALATALVLVPTTASAKGPSEVEITGPGLEPPIRLDRDSAITDQMNLLMEMIDMWGASESSSTSPAERLGPRYLANVSMIGPEGDETVRKELYPFADGGPVVHTRRGQQLYGNEVVSGWIRADDRLDSLLVSLGVRAPAGADLEWLTHHDYEHGLSISYPPSWQPAKSRVAPELLDPVIPIALGTYDFPTAGCGAVPGPALQELGPTDAFVAIYVATGPSMADTDLQRPAGFGPDLPWSTGPVKCAEKVRGDLRTLTFEDGDRRLQVLVAVGEEVSTRRQRQVYRILDTLTAEPPLA